MTPWDWLGLGIILLILELVISGVFLFWVGLAALVMSLILFLGPDLSWQSQIITFGFFTLVFVLGWATLGGGKSQADKSLAEGLNSRTQQFIGRETALIEPIINGRGVVSIDDTRWNAYGQDAPLGTQVRIIGVRGNYLDVVNVESV